MWYATIVDWSHVPAHVAIEQPEVPPHGVVNLVTLHKTLQNQGRDVEIKGLAIEPTEEGARPDHIHAHHTAK